MATRQQIGTVNQRFSRLRVAVRWLTLAYPPVLAGTLVLLDFSGGNPWWSSLALFFPPLAWLVPAAVLLTLNLLLSQRLWWAHLLAVVLVFFGYMRWHWPLSSDYRGSQARPAVLLLSNNIAQRDLSSLWAFARDENPDILAFQDIGDFALHANSQFPGYNTCVNGEFALITRFPIRDVKLVPGMDYHGRPVAFRYELLIQGRKVVIYNVHMPTPRHFFLILNGGGLIHSIRNGGGIFSKAAWRLYADYWRRRVELSDVLLQALRNEPNPFILAGDFNMPDHGQLYRRFSGQIRDAFALAGTGYGLTFGKNIPRILSLNLPWLRIDYQFVSSGWQVHDCRVEPHHNAEHLALIGRYTLAPK